MIDDQILEDPENEEEEGNQEEDLRSEIERLLEVLLPPMSDQDIERLQQDLEPVAFPGEGMIEKIAAAIERGRGARSGNDSIA
ncbi:MAG: hypothetical protein ABSE41_14620 [Bacteroidota bacterium]|jgi:hypothetical protein